MEEFIITNQDNLAGSTNFTSLTGFYQNCKSLNELILNVKCIISKLYIYCTVWNLAIHDDISNFELGNVKCKYYNISRNNRCISNSGCSRGGSVLVGIHKDFPECCVTVTLLNFDHIFVLFMCKQHYQCITYKYNKQLFFRNHIRYRPPSVLWTRLDNYRQNNMYLHTVMNLQKCMI